MNRPSIPQLASQLERTLADARAARAERERVAAEKASAKKAKRAPRKKP